MSIINIRLCSYQICNQHLPLGVFSSFESCATTSFISSSTGVLSSEMLICADEAEFDKTLNSIFLITTALLLSWRLVVVLREDSIHSKKLPNTANTTNIAINTLWRKNTNNGIVNTSIRFLKLYGKWLMQQSDALLDKLDKFLMHCEVIGKACADLDVGQN